MIDKSKQYRTRDGREVRIYATDGPPEGDYAIHGAVKLGGDWFPKSWMPDGRYVTYPNGPHNFDLIEVRPRIKREVWVNVYPDRNCYHDSKEKADHHRSSDAIAFKHITIDCEEGEGL